jgi:tRNA wybutosine-synthesizing protein 4
VSSDPLAFQCLSNDAFRCRKTRFIDVDFPELIAKKREIVLNTPQLKSLVGSYQILEHCSGIHLRSEHYSALGCNLTDIPKLEALLTNDTDLSRALILCIAEVSVTYMDVDAADSLIHWAANHNDSMIKFMAIKSGSYFADSHQYAFVSSNSIYRMASNIPLRRR